jgi:uncharacterized membrane-anchored protein YhcB (DUF1043 family)
MRIFPLLRPLSLAAGIIGPGFLAMPALAEDAGNVHELQRVIEAQQKQLEAQQQQLDAQRRLLQELQSQIKALAKDEEKEAETVTAEKPQEKPPLEPAKARPQRRAAISQEEMYDRKSPSGSNFTYFDPTKTINIPGTNTSIGLHGIAEFQMIHDTNGQDNNRFDTADIPVDGAPSQTKFNVNPSQLRISSSTLVPDGQLNTMISMDFNGENDRPEPRLRIAYGEFVSGDLGLGLLAGQTYATMLDLRAVPETLDFAGPASLWQQRQPLLRVTKAFADTLTAEVALETPENTSYIDAERRTRWPDLTVAGTWFVGDKYINHLRLAGVARDLRAEGTNGSTDSALGWAVGGSAKLELPFLGAKDNLKLNIHYGDGYGSQLKGGPKEAAFNTGNSELKTIGIFGTYGGIQHFWSDRFRSNLVYGYVNSDNPGFVTGNTYDNTNYVAADIIWNPYKTVTLGAEYLWGRRENKDGEDGDANRFVFSSRFDF